jgi:hypothetical protein
MVDHANYAEYTVEECIQALWGTGEVKWPEGIDYNNLTAAQRNSIMAMVQPDYTKVWLGTLWQAQWHVSGARDTLSEAHKNVEIQTNYLAGPNGVWQGPAARSFNRILKGVNQWAQDTVTAVLPPHDWVAAFQTAYSALQAKQILAWFALQEGFVTIAGTEVTKYFRNSKPKDTEVPASEMGKFGVYEKKVGSPPKLKFDAARAAAAMRPHVIALAGTYYNLEQQFLNSKPPEGATYEPAPPAEDPQKKIDDINKEAKKEIDDLKKEYDKQNDEAAEKAEKDAAKAQADFDKAQEKSQADLDKAQEKAEKDAAKAQADFDKAQEKFGTELEKAQKLPENLGGALPPLAGTPGGGLPPSLADLPFTLPGDVPPPGADIPPPFPPPDGTIFPLDKNGQPIRGGAIFPGAVPPPRLDSSAGPATPRFVRPPGNLDGLDGLDQPARRGGFRLPGGDLAPTGSPGARSLGGIGEADEFGNASRPRAGAADPNAPVAGGVRGGLGGLGAGGYPPMMPPMGGGMGGMAGMGHNPQGERDRQTWLLEDDAIWTDGGDALPTVLGRVSDADEEEYSPRY